MSLLFAQGRIGNELGWLDRRDYIFGQLQHIEEM
jgi:hypothetical protein